MINPIAHIVLPDLAIDFSADDLLMTLVVTRATGDGGSIMFLWRTDVGARVVRVLKDSSSDLELQKDVALHEFPIDNVISVIRENSGMFAEEMRAQIIRILDETRNGGNQ